MTDFSSAVAVALAEQPWFVRRKDTIVAVAGTLLQVANIAFAYTTNSPEWVNFAIAAVIGVCQVVIHAGTPGAITPSMGRRLEATAATIPDGSGYEEGAAAASDAGLATPNIDDPQGGAHRISDFTEE